jgi:hypothetical protein
MDDYHFTPWVNQLVAQIWLNLLMDDYHFTPPWVNQLVAQIWVNKSSYG